MLSETVVNEYRHHGHSIRVIGSYQSRPDDLMLRLFTIADWLCKMVKSSYKMTLTCWLYNDRKRLPSQRGAKLKPEHLNSGMTVFPSRHIYLWRLQEIEKVLIHELIHALRLDHGWANLVGPVKGPGSGERLKVLWLESWTEAMAVFYYQVFLRYCGVHAKLDETIQRDELQHNAATCGQFLEHFGYRSMRELLDHPGKWKEDTNGWAYYIGRRIIMCSPYFWQMIARKGLGRWTSTMIQRCIRDIDWTAVEDVPIGSESGSSKWILATSTIL